MKKVLLIFLALCFFSLSACNCTNTGYNNIVELAISDLEDFWEDYYKGVDAEQNTFELSIKNTRVINIINNNDIKDFEDIDLIIEFTILTDYYLTNNKYLVNPGYCDSVVVYKDGRREISARSPIQHYMMKYYDATFPMIEKVTDLGSDFNKDITIKI